MLRYLDMGEGFASASDRFNSVFRVANEDQGRNKPLPRGVEQSNFAQLISEAIFAVNNTPGASSQLALHYLLGAIDSIIPFGHEQKLLMINSILFDAESGNQDHRMEIRPKAEPLVLAREVARIVFS